MDKRYSEILSDSTIVSFAGKDQEVKVEVQLYTEEKIVATFSDVQGMNVIQGWGVSEDIGELISTDESILLNETIVKLIENNETNTESYKSFQFKDSREEVVLEIVGKNVSFS